MAQAGLSSFGDSFQPVCEKCCINESAQQVKGEERWTMIDNHTWDMILGKSGRLPGTLAPEIIELAKSKGYEFVDTDPQLNYPDALDEYRKEMDENGWEYGRG